MELSEPIALEPLHDVSQFDCGKETLNIFLKSYALVNQKGGSARTYVVLENDAVVAYYSLAPTSVEHVDAPSRITKGQSKHPVPCILLARLAVDRRLQGFGVGKFLFRDSLIRSLRAHELVGGRAFLVHAKDDEAAAFYAKYGIICSPTHTNHLYLLFKDIRAMLLQSQRGQ